MEKPIIKGRALRPLLFKKQIQERIQKLATQITEDYKDKELLCIGILNGACIFFTDLIKKIDIDLEIDFIRFSSYKNGETTGEVSSSLNLKNSVYNKHVLIIEDIIDTGTTFYKTDIINKFMEKGALSCKICAFASKPGRLIYPVQIDYLGFEFPDNYVVGYGFDYNEKGRNTEDIYCIEE